ncbi:D-cysteine desulfhydrase family protein [Candidatus Bathyarchaeota archaeon]|nr:D-cysteine desulfhydrase family protein [Candidatus Bathyarchaeota archaeon]
MNIGRLPRVRLATLPTPLDEAPRLTKMLGGPRILFKRDDNDGFALGGNKARKLEFLIADAMQKGADTIITTGGVQSNHARITAAAAKRYGMRPILVLRGDSSAEYDGNLLLDKLFGAEIRIVAPDMRDTMPIMQDIAEEMRDGGREPYIIPSGGSNPVGAIAYSNAMLEIISQAVEMSVKVDHVVFASGSGGTQGGLLFGAKALNFQGRILGISDGASRDPLASKIVEIANGCARLIDSHVLVSLKDVDFLDQYAGKGYGILQKEVVDAIMTVAGTEGILLDPVYTGKAMWGLMDLIHQGYFEKDETVVFIHTGGTPALFAYRKELVSFLGS